MKRIYSILFIACLAFLASCSDDDDNEVPVPDYKAEQILSTSSLYQSLGRQPEMSESLVNTTARLAQYNEIAELLPLNDKAEEERGIARGKCLSECFEAIGRQPEVYDLIDKVAEKFLGSATTKTMSVKILEYSRLYALTGLNSGLARNYAVAELYDKFSRKYLGITLEDVIPAE